MTGFVDPAFKHIKTTEPNFLLWRISKNPEESYEAKPIKKAFWGDFCSKQSYIVYCATPVNRPRGITVKDPLSKMEIHIHFWLGSELSHDNCNITLMKATELDEVLGGRTVLHREVEGHESNRFLSYFKQGMFIKCREIVVSGRFKSSSETKLYSLFERASTLILTEHPKISWNYINVHGVYVLEDKGVFFVWIGNSASKEKRFIALKFGTHIKKREGYRKIVWVLDGEEKELSAEDLVDFQKHLNLESKTVGVHELCDSFALKQTKSRLHTKLYMVTDGEDGAKLITHIKDGPLEQSDLRGMDNCIVEHVDNGSWIWVSKKVSEEGRSRAINIVAGYQDKRCKGDFETCRETAARVVEGAEPAEFKMLFRNWVDYLPTGEQLYFTKKTPRPINCNSFIYSPVERCFRSSTKVFRVVGDQLEPLHFWEYGIFYSDSIYLVQHSCKTAGEQRKALFYWMGSNVSRQERQNRIMLPLADIPNSDASVIFKIQEFYEPPHFRAIFRGLMLVLNTRRDLEKGKFSAASEVLLIKVFRWGAENGLSIEVNPLASSLNSNSVFILMKGFSSYVWCGMGSTGDQRESAKRVAERWGYYYQVLREGEETKDFWDKLGGYQEYKKLKSERKCSEIGTATEVAVPPRAFKCSFLDEGLIVSEIINFERSDLCPYDIVILDVWRMIYVWIGREVPKEKLLRSENVAVEYLKRDPSRRSLSIPIIQVRDNQEPQSFCGLFKSWDTDSKLTFDDEDVQKIFVETRPRQMSESQHSDGILVQPVCGTASSEEVSDHKVSIEQLEWKTAEELPPSVDRSRREE